MMNVLDALRYRLTAPGSTDLEGETIDPALLEAMGLRSGRFPQQLLPPGLPLVVQDQIRNQPGYPEGDVIPGPRNPLMEQEVAAGAFTGPQREAPLAEDIGVAEFLKRQDIWPTPEGAAPWRPSGLPRFASPLNQLLKRGPFGQY